jgi:hypothetical protein
VDADLPQLGSNHLVRSRQVNVPLARQCHPRTRQQVQVIKSSNQPCDLILTNLQTKVIHVSNNANPTPTSHTLHVSNTLNSSFKLFLLSNQIHFTQLAHLLLQPEATSTSTNSSQMHKLAFNHLISTTSQPADQQARYLIALSTDQV